VAVRLGRARFATRGNRGDARCKPHLRPSEQGISRRGGAPGPATAAGPGVTAAAAAVVRVTPPPWRSGRSGVVKRAASRGIGGFEAARDVPYVEAELLDLDLVEPECG
jgi:hypothetical protein